MNINLKDSKNYMPGQKPYTDEQIKAHQKLMESANKAIDEFGEDELERWAKENCNVAK